MSDYPSWKDDQEKRIVFVRAVRVEDLPEPVRRQVRGADRLYSIHAPSGEVLALAPDRRQAFILARQNEFAPVSVH